MKVCQSCKIENEDQSAYCTHCGCDIRDTPIHSKEKETPQPKRERVINCGVMKAHGTAAFIVTLIAAIISGVGTVFGCLLALEGSTHNVGAWAFSFVLFLSLNGLIQLVKDIEVNSRGK